MAAGHQWRADDCRRLGHSTLAFGSTGSADSVGHRWHPTSLFGFLTGLLAAGRSHEANAMMKFRHAFTVCAPVSVVAAFHRNPDNLVALTPFPVRVKLLSAPCPLQAGDEVAFRLWLGFIPIRWVARIVQMDETGFTDVQLCGPFRHWVHRHRFVPQSDGTTLVIDQIDAAFSWHPVRLLIGLLMWLGLPMLFAYRRRVMQRQISRLMEAQKPCKSS
jgi:ligand-binding SRPBCC domain-containing protein